MPNYNYTCKTHGTFTKSAPLAEFEAPQNCPTCEKPAPKDFISAPQIATKGGRPKANMPGGGKGRQVKHAPGCSCCS